MLLTKYNQKQNINIYLQNIWSKLTVNGFFSTSQPGLSKTLYGPFCSVSGRVVIIVDYFRTAPIPGSEMIDNGPYQ